MLSDSFANVDFYFTITVERMAQQSTLSGEQPNRSSPSESVRSERSNNTDRSTNTTKINCEDVVDEWVSHCSETDRNFAFSQIGVRVQERLDGRSVGFSRNTRIERSLADRGIGNFNGSGRSWSMGMAENPLFKLAQWRVNQLALPERVRGISASKIRVFAPEAGSEYVAIPETWPAASLEEAIDLINSIEDVAGSEDFDRVAARYTTARTRSSHSGPVQERIHGLENTIRHRLDFSSKYGGEVPEAHSDFEELDLIELREELEAARADLAEAEDRKNHLNDRIGSLKADRRDRLAPEWLNVDK